MKLILLPGMDGTGMLFDALLPELSDYECEVCPLPDVGDQSYQVLAEYVTGKLPEGEFILIAESFSGGIAAVLSEHPPVGLKGIIFVASFLSSPQKVAAFIASCLPLHLLLKLPFSSVFIRWFMLGRQADSGMVASFRKAVSHTSARVLRDRLRVISSMKYSGFTSALPAYYIRAENDLLVSEKQQGDFQKAYADIKLRSVKGPHFILQANTSEAALVIKEAIRVLSE